MLTKPNAGVRRVAQKDFDIRCNILTFTSHVLSNKRLTTGANDGSRTHDLPITNRLLYL
jgi:hypothetical protein